MIRDPSDGSLREPKKPEALPSEDPFLAEIKAALLAGKVRPEKVSEKWAYQRAWNDGIDFSLTQIDRIAKHNPERVMRLLGDQGEGEECTDQQ